MQEITGRHVLFTTVGAFGVIIAVNLVMAYKAVSTFPGLEVANSYIASQDFDARREAQNALGWKMGYSYEDESGILTFRFTDDQGKPVRVADVTVLIGRTTESTEDQSPLLSPTSEGWAAQVPLSRGKWLLRVQAHSPDGVLFDQRVSLIIKG